MGWTPMRLEEDKAKDKREIISVSINAEERIELDKIKLAIGIKMDSKALKLCAKVGANVIHGFSIAEIIKYALKRKD